MIVDTNIHWKPDSFYGDESFWNACLRAIPRAYGEHVEFRDIPGTGKRQYTVSRPKGYQNVNGEPSATDPEARLRAMDEAGIDKGILRWPLWPEWATLEMCRKVNDQMAKSVRQHPDRLLGLAIVPPWGDKDCLQELDRCINELGFSGIEIEAHYGTLYLDAEEFKPFFKRINELNMPVIVHHTALPVDYGSIYDYTNLRRMIGRCIDQLTSVGRLLCSGVFDEFPNLKFIHSMLGGGLFAFTGLLTTKKSTVAGDRERHDPEASEKILGYMKRNIFYGITHAPPWGKEQLECAVKVYGSDHVLFGTSYPLRLEWAYKGVDYIRNLDISENDKKLILGDNAVKLFNIKK